MSQASTVYITTESKTIGNNFCKKKGSSELDPFDEYNRLVPALSLLNDRFKEKPGYWVRRLQNARLGGENKSSW